MKNGIFLILLSVFILTSCGSDESAANASSSDEKAPAKTEEIKEVAKEVVASATGDMANKGIGPIKNVELEDEIDQMMVKEGKEIFKLKCSACHKISKKKIGPGMKGITERRSSEWIMNMIMNPEEMVAKDPIAMALLAEYSAPMANQNIKEDEARALLEYFRTKN